MAHGRHLANRHISTKHNPTAHLEFDDNHVTKYDFF